MKMPTDIVKMYREIHGWVGIVAGLALFIAFFAGALTMFEAPLQHWASPPSPLSPAPALDRTPELIAQVIAAHPDAARGHEVNLAIDANHPARVTWRSGDPEAIAHGGGAVHHASLSPGGRLEIDDRGLSPVAQFIDDLHRKVGLPFGEEVASPIMGAVSLLYFVALVSGLAVLLPSLAKDLFTVRLGRNVKRMWLDLHNLLGVFSLPFHVVIALTSVTFAFHDQFYMAQGMAFGGGRPPRPAARVQAEPAPPLLPPAVLVERLRIALPGFTPLALAYARSPDGDMTVRATGGEQDYPDRTPLHGVVGIDPVSGRITSVDYMPGQRDGWAEAVASFFMLHQGRFGGVPIRWAYFLLGLAGAFLFHTGNLLWVESRRKRERKTGAVEQTRATRMLGALTIGVPMGCVAGIAATIAAARLPDPTVALHGIVYHTVFVGCVLWAMLRGAARSGWELPVVAAVAVAAIPAASLADAIRGAAGTPVPAVDMVATMLTLSLLVAARKARRRALDGPRDSVWSMRPVAATTAA